MTIMTPEHQELLGCIAIFGGLPLLAWLVHTIDYYLHQWDISIKDILLYPVLLAIGVWYKIAERKGRR